MRINDKGLALIKSFEGCKLKAYQDVVGVWTIGYGCTDGVKPGQVITQEQADLMLANELAQFEKGVGQAVKVGLHENEFAALVAFSYNVGLGALMKSTLLKMLNAGDRGGAADQFLRWNKAGGKVYAGLTRRREAERALFLSR